MRKGNLFVVSGPSGAGKGTLVALLLQRVPDAWLSVSATTRAPRAGEQDGVNYFFLSRDAFEQLVEQKGFLEWAEYAGNLYGTPRAAVEEMIAQGRQVILEIDVQGALQVRALMPDAHLVFIEPPSMDILEERLRSRGTEDEQTVARRMEAAKVELAKIMEYDKRLLNDDLETAAQELVAYVDEHAEIE